MASSAYAKHGELYDAFKKYYGAAGPPEILVAYGSSRDMNPSLPQDEIDRALEKDPVRNRAEYLSEFRSDVEGFIPREIVESCVGDYHELPPNPSICYRCFVDAASGVPEGDSYTIAISHKLGDRVIVDAIREVRPPFSPAAVVNDVLIPLCKAYSIHSVTGDNYAGEFAKEPVRAFGIAYELAKKHKSELYNDPFLPLLNSNKIDLPRNDRAINQICSLERSVQRSGRDQITHPTHGHDDIANAVAGAVDVAFNFVLFDSSWSWVDGVPIGAVETAEQRRARRKSGTPLACAAILACTELSVGRRFHEQASHYTEACCCALARSRWNNLPGREFLPASSLVRQRPAPAAIAGAHPAAKRLPPISLAATDPVCRQRATHRIAELGLTSNSRRSFMAGRSCLH